MPRLSAKKSPQPRNPRNDRKPNPADLSHESIAADVEAFRKAGGKIEVLGNTPTLKKIGVS